jgi:sugar phosphate isomerase/epimerase
MRPCISQATTLSTPFELDVDALALGGWNSVEVWLTKLETYLQSRPVAEAKSLLDDRGLRAVAASGQGGLLLSRGAERAAAWELFRRRIAILNELGVPNLIVAADHVAEASPEDYGRAVESLAEAAEVARGSGVRIALEFQKGSRWCSSLDTAVAVVEQAGGESAGLGVCLDLFHYYTGPSKFEDLAYLSAGNLAWVQACDLSGVPRELAGDSDRILPGEGDFQLGPILDHLASIGYDGYISLEVLNPQLWSISPDRVADVGRQALERLLARVGPSTESKREPSWGQP